jgi:BirA family biotin operon repressor/biotin-[acetyl-CoA-carboxylase] ligase
METLEKIPVPNPFGAPVYRLETTSSTMDESRKLAARGEGHGTVVTAGFQEAGRGRTPGRSWIADRGRNLFCTILLRYPGFASVPPALTLRTGLALALAAEDFAPPLAGAVTVKWPNDLMIGSGAAARKAAGILTEGDGRTIHIGIGVNVAQTVFPPDCRDKATSIALALGGGGKTAFPAPPAAGPPDAPLLLLEKILARLYREIAPPEGGPGEASGGAGAGGTAGGWRERLTERLYMRGRPVSFFAGGAGSGELVEGTLEGIGPGGELLIIPRGEAAARSFTTGELAVYGPLPCTPP